MLPNDVTEALTECVIEPCGSRVTCNPPPLNTDRDFLVVMPDDHEKISVIVSSLDAAGFSWEGSEHYQDAAGDFMSWRRDDVNLIVTRNAAFATRHRAATYVCTRLNLQNKPDRIAVFQAVLYGNQHGEERHDCSCGAGGKPLCASDDRKTLEIRHGLREEDLP